LLNIFFSVLQQPKKAFLDHTHTPGRNEWSAFRRGRYLHKNKYKNEHPCPMRDLNPRSQQSSGCRNMPNTARPPGSAC